MGVKVTVIVEAGDGELSYFEAEGATYDAAKAAARPKCSDSTAFTA